MKRTLLLSIMLLAAFWCGAYPAIELSGGVRNDAYFQKTTNDWRFGDVLENKLIFSRKAEDWRFYGDLRVDLLFGFASQMLAGMNFTVNLPRLFIRYNSPIGDFTAGKTYVNFGNPGIFNPFEVMKTINFSDLAYDKEGMLAFLYDFSFNDLSGGKLYFGPSSGITNSAIGGSLYVNLFSFDAGLVANRKDIDKNITGLYFKGDLEIGINASWAYHFTDAFTNNFNEASAGIDYSFFDGKLFTGLTFYYDEKGAANTNEYANALVSDVYQKAKYYLYGTISYQHDEFLGFRFDAFLNLVDYSSVLMPSVSYMISDGLTLTLLFDAVLGDDNQEFTRDLYGEYTFLLRVEGKL